MKAAVRAVRFFQALSHPDWRGQAVAGFLYGLLRLIHPRAKRIDANLRLVHPEWDRARRAEIRRGVYCNLAWTITEVLALQRDPVQVMEWISQVEGRDTMDGLLESPRGAVLLTGHFGNWEAGGSWWSQLLREQGRELYVIYQELHDPDLSATLTEFRERGGMRPLLKETSTLELVRMLRDGAHIAILQDVSWGGGVVVPFLGQPCTNAPGPAVLAMLAGVPIVPAGFYRRAPFQHTVRFLPPIRIPKEGDREERVRWTLGEMNRALGEIIERQPEQWFWLHNRWKK